jgi:integrase
VTESKPGTKPTRQADIDKITAQGMHLIEGGLYLQVAGPDSRSWIFRYQHQGKPRWLGLGSARTGHVTLAQARNARDDARALIRKGVDPVQHRRDARVQVRVAERSSVTFRERAEQYLQAHESAWENAKHREQWRATLRSYVYPALGNLPAMMVTAGHIVDLLRPIWAEKPETARRIRGRIESVLDYAADPDDSTFRNPAAMTAQLLKRLPKVNVQRVNHPALPYDEAPAFMAELHRRDGAAALALEFTILTAVRTNETLGARWDEIDHASRVWVVPAGRMKKRREHRVPLSAAALAVLERVNVLRVGEFVFPSVQDRPLSNMAMLATLKRMNRSDLTVHGFRATFRTWAAETTSFPHDVIEAALAHVIEDKTQAAYQRGDLLQKRARLMEAWSKFVCSKAAPGAVVPLRA